VITPAASTRPSAPSSAADTSPPRSLRTWYASASAPTFCLVAFDGESGASGERSAHTAWPARLRSQRWICAPDAVE
jgi:hypothetical protein